MYANGDGAAEADFVSSHGLDKLAQDRGFLDESAGLAEDDLGLIDRRRQDQRHADFAGNKQT
jgi:hypothetical protein